MLQKDETDQVLAALPGRIGQAYRSDLEIYSAEVQQIFQQESTAFIFGARYQTGEFGIENQHSITRDSFLNPTGASLPPSWFSTPPQAFASNAQRATGYGYAHWQASSSLQLMGGLSYDWLVLPENFRFAPLSGTERNTSQLSPKAGLLWTPWTNATVRAAYTRSLGGASIDQSFTLEPTQVAGFNQAWRSIIPESVAGANAGEKFETWGLSLEQKLSTQTYIALGGEVLKSEVDRTVGVFDFYPPQSLTPPYIFGSGTSERLDYEERSFSVSVHQLLGRECSLTAEYRLSHAELADSFTEIPQSAPTTSSFRPERDLSALLQQLRLAFRYQHPSGVFAQFGSRWMAQSNHGYTPEIQGDDFWQFDAVAGHRFFHRRIEAKVGVLNLTGQHYRLNPLNMMLELPRERTVVVGLKFQF